jgi:hypothetical protein
MFKQSNRRYFKLTDGSGFIVVQDGEEKGELVVTKLQQQIDQSLKQRSEKTELNIDQILRQFDLTENDRPDLAETNKINAVMDNSKSLPEQIKPVIESSKNPAQKKPVIRKEVGSEEIEMQLMKNGKIVKDHQKSSASASFFQNIIPVPTVKDIEETLSFILRGVAEQLRFMCMVFCFATSTCMLSDIEPKKSSGFGLGR